METRRRVTRIRLDIHRTFIAASVVSGSLQASDRFTIVYRFAPEPARPWRADAAFQYGLP